jgi:hypothetical protein
MTLKTNILNTLTRKHTAFVYFADLIASTDREYFPSLYVWQGTSEDCIERMVLADAYDAKMKRSNDPRRAWRGTRPVPEVEDEAAAVEV